jgi:CheY-like chemotaxis protein
MMAVVSKDGAGRGITGSLDRETALELIEPICRSGKNASLMLQMGGETAEILIHDGRIVMSSSNTVKDDEAAYYLGAWKGARFTLKKGHGRRSGNVNIEWSGFQRAMQAELEKLVLGAVSRIHLELFFEMRNMKNEVVFQYSNSKSISTKVESLYLFYRNRIEKVIKEINGGGPGYVEKVSDNFTIIISHVEDTRHISISIFSDTSRADAYKSWLGGELKDRLPDAVCRALEKADTGKARARVLVVDDSPTILAVMMETLSDNKYEVITATDGYEGLIKARDVKPGLIFLDVMMPKMDGYEMCKRLKADPELRKIPVIMLTSKDLAEDDGAAFREGANMYIQKPFTAKKIIAMVESVMGDE